MKQSQLIQLGFLRQRDLSRCNRDQRNTTLVLLPEELPEVLLWVPQCVTRRDCDLSTGEARCCGH